MAEAAHEVQGETTLKRIKSYEILPPNMREVRVVLLGNNQSERNRIGNLLLGQTVFNEYGALSNCMKVIGVKENSQMVVINTPDLLDPDISLDELSEKFQNCVTSSDPGPHVFLLVLQPEEFREEQCHRLQTFLEFFGRRSFDHSLVLVSPRRNENIGHMINYVEYPSLDEMIRKCRYRHIQQKNHERLELLTRLGQVVKENHEQHVHSEAYKDASDLTSADDSKRPDARSSGPERAADSGLRIVLLGKSDNKKTTLGNSIINNQSFSSLRLYRINYVQSQTKQVADGEWDGKSLKVVKTTDLFSQSVGSVTKEIEEICASDCSPGPNAFLLLLKPSEFTEEDRHTLKGIMALFHQEDFNNFIVIKTDEGDQENNPVKETIKDCGGRLYSMNEDNIPSLMEKMKKIVSEHKGRCLASVKGSDTMTPMSNPPLNLVLCGTRGAGKTSAANAILGQTENSSGSNSPTECVKRQAVVCDRWVTLVELPSLNEKSEAMIHNALRCVSLCDPEGVHAFLLAVPLGPLTDEDKAELQSIQDVFTSEISDFTRVLLTVESDPTAQACANFVDQDNPIKELCQSYADRYTVFNIKNRQQVPELLKAVEKMRRLEGRPLCFTREMFIKVQMEKIIQQDKVITTLQAEGKKSEKPSMCDHDDQSLRMVLIGKTGSGKSASGNTILNQKTFTSEPSQSSVTKVCQKAHAEVDGRRVVVVDTPGLFDTSLSQEEVQQEMIKCISLLAPGPHVFLLVLEIGRLTEEEKKTLHLIQDAFGKDSKKFTIILFTKGEILEHHGKSIEEYIKTCDDSFRKLISDCGERYHVFKNLDGKNREQVSDLLMKVKEMVKENGGECYTTEMFQEAEAAIQKKMEKILKEKEDEMKREVEDLKRTHEEEKQTMTKRMKEQEDEIEKERKKTQLKEKEDSINKEREEREKERVKREEEDKKRTELEENKRKEWNEKLKALERENQKASEEKDRQLELKRKEMIEQGDAWEKERRAWLDKRRLEDEERREDEHNKIKRLQEEFDQEREKHEKKRTEEDKKRQEEEKKQQAILQERKKEQEKREMEDKQRKEEEENKLMEWKKTLEVLEREKNKGSEEMRKEKENWEKERERWNEKEQEDKDKREEEEKKIKRLQEEFENERKEHERKRKEEDKHRQEEEVGKQRIVDEFRKKEQKEQQRRDEEDRKRKTEDEMKQKEWENKVKALKRERERSEEIDRKLLKNQREEMRKKQEDWEQERKRSWNKRQQEDEQRREEQHKKIKKLQEEFDQEREKHEKTKKEEVQKIRQQEEKEREKLEKEHQGKLELMENKHKDEARKKAEEFNDFKEKYLKALEDLLQKQEAEIRDLEQTQTAELKQGKDKYDLSSHKVTELQTEVDTKAGELEDMKKKHGKQQEDLKKKYHWRPGCINS